MLARRISASICILAVMSLALAARASVQRPDGAGGPPSFDTLLDGFDANDDGALAAEELPQPVQLRIARADADSNGIVTRAEFDAVRARDRKPPFDRFLTVFDADGDGALSASELPTPVWIRMSLADSDADRVITRAEYEGFDPDRRPPFDKFLAAFDADGNGALARAELPQPAWIRMSLADANSDGMVTRDEYDAYDPGSEG